MSNIKVKYKKGGHFNIHYSLYALQAGLFDIRYSLRLSLLLGFIALSAYTHAINLSIHIYSAEKTTAVIISPFIGGYTIEADGKKIDSCNTSSVYQIMAVNDSLMLKTVERTIGKFSQIRFRGNAVRNQFYIKSAADKFARHYDDDIILASNSGALKLVNMVELEHYVSGVVYCEGGQKKPEEYYKVQAIICRTYALNNIARHINDGFELCDAVHCQAYQGATTNKAILQAVEATRGMVLVDNNNQLINAAFHANCGGYTLNSEDVWNTALSYLRAKQDTFCLHQPAANWEKSISKDVWNKYLSKKEATMQKDNLYAPAHWDSIPPGKKIVLYDNGYLIPLKDIRADWNLRSTLFTIENAGDTVLLHGRGYGHRVGLCQEGAIRMVQLGYNAQQILHFYYYNVQLIDYSILQGFN